MRDVRILCGLAAAAVAVGVFIFSASGGFLLSSQPAAATVPFAELAHGARSLVSTRVNYLITSADQLTALWKLVETTQKEPAIDFTKNTVVAVFAGQRPTTGYAIAIANIVDGLQRLVSVKVSVPDTTCIEAQMVTAPYQIVSLPATTLSFTHEDTIATTSCSQ